MTNATLVQAAAEELGVVVGALLDAPGTVGTAAFPVEPRWYVSLAFTGPTHGSLVLGFDSEGAQRLAQLVMGLDEAPADSAVADTLLEVCGQALSAVGQHTGFQGLRLVEATIVPKPPLSKPITVSVGAGDRFATGVACWATIEITAIDLPADPGAAPRSLPATLVAPVNLDLILDIELPLTVRFGETEMTLQSLTRLAPGSIIDLGRSPDDPVDVLVNGRLVARAEVVVVAGNYGVRIVEVISAAERLRTVAA